jgi:hypothetical protein
MADELLVYRGHKSDLLAFLPGFAIPVPLAWFDVLFVEYREAKKLVYRADAYAVATGYIVYDCKEAYEAELWADAMKKLGFAGQVEWAQSAAGASDCQHALMEVTILKPDVQRKALRKERTLTTRQGRFLAFLKSGKLVDLDTEEAEGKPTSAV